MQTNLGQMITEIQRDAAGTSTPDLRADIEVGLEVLDAAITDLHALRPGADVMERINATSDFMETVITIALYVRELATRPADQPHAGRHQPQLARSVPGQKNTYFLWPGWGSRRPNAWSRPFTQTPFYPGSCVMPKSNRGAFRPRFRHGHRHRGTGPPVLPPHRQNRLLRPGPIIGLLAATVLASKWHPILALLAGIGIGLVAALIVAAVVLAWPVLRVLWWWAPEITLAFSLVTGWVDLADHTTLPVPARRSSSCIVGVPAAIPPVRRRIIAATWCLITRHRIRICFSEFIITNRTGSLPLILLGHPHPGRGTRLDLAAARPGPGRPAKPARPDRGRLLGRHRHRRIRLRVQRRVRPAGHQTPRRPHRHRSPPRCWT